MRRIIEAVVANIQNNATLNAFMGTGGPFWELAPEGTALPTIVLNNVGGRNNLQGFTPNYIEKADIQMTVRGDDLESVGINTEALASAFDKLGSLTLGGGEITRKPVRFEAPRFVHEPIDTDGRRVYAGIVEYFFNVQRSRGVTASLAFITAVTAISQQSAIITFNMAISPAGLDPALFHITNQTDHAVSLDVFDAVSITANFPTNVCGTGAPWTLDDSWAGVATGQSGTMN